MVAATLLKEETDNAINDDFSTRRKASRRPADNCITIIDGKAYPVHNWSEGGMMIQADERMFSMSAPIEMTLKFRLNGRIVDIAHRGHVIRKMRDRVVVQFEPLNREISQKFKKVIDDYVTREFVDSQLA